MDVKSKEARDLVLLISETFRVHQNQEPVYVDIGDVLPKIGVAQHQVIFGRRGTGKSCLLVHYRNKSKADPNVRVLYINCDANKRGGFPDLLTSLLISIFEGLPGGERKGFGLILPKKSAEKTADNLRLLLHSANASEIESRNKDSLKGNLKSGNSVVPISAAVEGLSETVVKEKYRREKLESLQRSTDQYRSVINKAVKPGGRKRCVILLDDFYLIDKRVQPDVVDYIHRLLRGTNVYFKIGSIRHRTNLRRHERQTIGVELGQDVQTIDLDRKLSDFDDTKSYLAQVLNALGNKCGIDNVTSSFLNVHAMQALTIASGGVPRDFLTIFSSAIELARKEDKARITPTHVWRVSAGQMQAEKRANLSEDAGVDADKLESAFADVVEFCLVERKKTVFLVEKADAQGNPAESEVLQQLMDFKLIHQIEADTSASSGKGGRRFSAYVLDASVFMHPRKRNIEVVEFWDRDDQRNPKGVRQAPIYEMRRIRGLVQGNSASVQKLDQVLQAAAAGEDMDLPDE